MNWARKAGYSPEALETGAARRHERARHAPTIFFAGGSMIPIHDEAGEVVAFSGRLLDPEAKAQKYVNSPETPVFSQEPHPLRPEQDEAPDHRGGQRRSSARARST